MKKYFKLSKVCEQFECDFGGTNGYGTLSNPEPGMSMQPDGMNFYVFYSLDGMIYFLDNCPNCSMGGWNLYVDVNGSKKPNILGRDVFTFYVNEQGILHPLADRAFAESQGTYLDYAYWNGDDMNGVWCKTPKTNTTSCDYCSGCAARIIEEGWKMNY